MQRIRTLGVALVAVLALGAVAVSSASASSFLAHPTSGTFPAAISDIQTNTHKFKTNGGTVECTKAISEGTATALKTLTQIDKVKYSGCTAFTFIEAQISEAEYEFSADLKVTQKNTVIITVKAPTICTVTVAPTGNSNLNSVHYGNSGSDIKINALVKGITYSTTGGFCGEPGTNGEYNGESIAGLTNGGALRWDKE